MLNLIWFGDPLITLNQAPVISHSLDKRGRIPCNHIVYLITYDCQWNYLVLLSQSSLFINSYY